MGKITIYKNTTSVNDPYYVSIGDAVERIKSGKSKVLIEKIRATKDEGEQGELKKQLPAYSFSGRFTKRGNNHCEEHSGYVAIDFDKMSLVEETKKELSKDKYVLACFISPRGNGLKVIMKIPPSKTEHGRRAAAITGYFKKYEVDEFRDISRLCYESYDSEIYFNPDSEVFMGIKEEPQKPTLTLTHNDIITDVVKVVDILEGYYNERGSFYTDGNKHNHLVSISTGCLRGGIPEVACLQELIKRYMGKASSVDPQDYTDLVHRIYTTYASSFGCSYFTEGKERSVSTGKEHTPENEFDFEDFVGLDTVREDMIRTFREGSDQGETTYFKEFDDHFRMKRGEITLFHGVTNHGKSTFVMQLCLLKSMNDGYRWAFFSPEQNPPGDFFNDLIHMYIGKTTLKGDYQMSMTEYEGGMDFVKRHFVMINPRDASPTPKFLLTRFGAVIDKYNVDGCIIDPYNQMINDLRVSGGREDQYLSGFLTTYKRFAQDRNIFMFIITHPKGDVRRDKDGDFEIPDIYNLAGGAMWSNKCDNVVCVYRPYFNTDKDSTSVWIDSQKIKKQRLCGRPGRTVMGFDWKTMWYNEVTQKSPLNKETEYITEEPSTDIWDSVPQKDTPF